jgi:hypothetical protein
MAKKKKKTRRVHRPVLAVLGPEKMDAMRARAFLVVLGPNIWANEMQSNLSVEGKRAGR